MYFDPYYFTYISTLQWISDLKGSLFSIYLHFLITFSGLFRYNVHVMFLQHTYHVYFLKDGSLKFSKRRKLHRKSSIWKNTGNQKMKNLTDTQLGGRGRPPLAFFENRKKCPDLGKKGPDCIDLWVKFSIQNVVLRISRTKNSKMLPCGTFFSCVFGEMFIEVL